MKTRRGKRHLGYFPAIGQHAAFPNQLGLYKKPCECSDKKSMGFGAAPDTGSQIAFGLALTAFLGYLAFTGSKALLKEA